MAINFLASWVMTMRVRRLMNRQLKKSVNKTFTKFILITLLVTFLRDCIGTYYCFYYYFLPETISGESMLVQYSDNNGNPLRRDPLRSEQRIDFSIDSSLLRTILSGFFRNPLQQDPLQQDPLQENTQHNSVHQEEPVDLKISQNNDLLVSHEQPLEHELEWERVATLDLVPPVRRTTWTFLLCPMLQSEMKDPKAILTLSWITCAKICKRVFEVLLILTQIFMFLFLLFNLIYNFSTIFLGSYWPKFTKMKGKKKILINNYSALWLKSD